MISLVLFCNQCGYVGITTEVGGSCPFCNGQLEEVGYVYDGGNDEEVQ